MRNQHPVAGASKVNASTRTHPSTSPRRDYLRATLLATDDMLRRRRADLIGDGVIGDYVALHWLEWNGGALRLTVAGEAVCDQLRAEAQGC